MAEWFRPHEWDFSPGPVAAGIPKSADGHYAYFGCFGVHDSFAVIGFFVGYRLEMTRAGYLTMALTTVGFSAGQIVHLFLTKSRDAMTMLPLVVGLVLVLCMLLGALVRLAVRSRTNAT